MIDPRDVDKVPDEEWEEFKKRAAKDELFYNGPGDMLDNPEGRAKFCRLNVSGLFNKDDPNFPGYKIWVFNNQGQGLVVKKRSRVDPALMENVEYDAEGKELSRSYEPA
ncbi:MAG: hypothetical protein IJQ42_06525 [Oscillospiraceae bacterium]|jgi:hypothetical protein|nr:hypothetical protein [Oscillospiraceae bacterium]